MEFAEFLEAFRKGSIPEWKEGVRGLDDEVAKGPRVVFYRRGEFGDDEDDEEDADEDPLPDQYDSYDGMDEDEEEDDL